MKVKNLLPLHLIDKILTYNIHPIAELVKPLFKRYELNDFDDYQCYEYILDNFCQHNCYFCHKFLNMNTEASIYSFNLCEKCCSFTNPNDDIFYYSAFELLEIKILENKIKYGLIK